MLGGRDEHAFPHQTGGVTDFRDVVADSFDLKAVQVGAAKQNARAAGSGEKAQTNRSPTMEADTAAFDGGPNCLLVFQEAEDGMTTRPTLLGKRQSGLWQLSHTLW